MIDTDRDFEVAVAAMLRRRASDIAQAAGAEVAPLPSPARHTPPSARNRRALIVAAVAAAFVPIVLLVALQSSDDTAVETTRADTTEVSSDVPPAESMALHVNVRFRADATYPHGSISLVQVTDSDGRAVGPVHTAGPGEVYDRWSEPGTLGSDITTNLDATDLPAGSYTVTLWQFPCDEGGCPSDPRSSEVLDAPAIDSCEAEVDGSPESLVLVAIVVPGQGCSQFGPGEDLITQAAGDLYLHQAADGWVPYGGRSALPDGSVPSEAWKAAGLGGGPGCTRPSNIDETVNIVCIYDAPRGSLIGYHISNLGYVPIEHIEDFEVDAAFTDAWGCSPDLDPACEVRHWLEVVRANLAASDLTPEEQASLEAQEAELERELQSILASEEQ